MCWVCKAVDVMYGDGAHVLLQPGDLYGGRHQSRSNRGQRCAHLYCDEEPLAWPTAMALGFKASKFDLMCRTHTLRALGRE